MSTPREGCSQTSSHQPGQVNRRQRPLPEVRRKKDEEEVKLIEGLQRRIDKVYKMLEGSSVLGRTERQVAADVMRLSTELGLSPLPRRKAPSTR